MSYETLKLDLGGPVATLTLNRPEVRNALNTSMLNELLAAFEAIDNSEATRALILTGAGRAFCAGADLADGPAGPSGTQSIGDQVRVKMEQLFNPVTQSLYDLGVPTIAAVNGVAAGGGVGLALSCDIVLAARSSRFVQVFIPRLGLIPDMGSSWYLPRLVGRARAMGLSFFGEPLVAETAEDWGLIWRCVDDDQLLKHAERFAHELSSYSTSALIQTRKAFAQAPVNSLAAQLAREVDIQSELCDDPDFVHKVTAFLNRD